MEHMSPELLVATAGLLVALFVWWFRPESLKIWFRKTIARLLGRDSEISRATRPGATAIPPAVQVAPPPYQSRSVRTDGDPVTAGIAADLGGIDGPCEPRMIIRYMVPEYEGKGYEVVRLEDGRECIWTGKVSDGSLRECVLMGKKPLIFRPPPAEGYTRCVHCGHDNHIVVAAKADLMCEKCHKLTPHFG